MTGIAGPAYRNGASQVPSDCKLLGGVQNGVELLELEFLSEFTMLNSVSALQIFGSS